MPRAAAAKALPRASDVRAELLSAATRLFAEHGFEGTSLQDVAALVGIRKASVFHHFASKEAMRAAVLEALLVHFGDLFPRLLTQTVSGKRRFDSAMEAAVDFFSADPNRARLLLREMLDRPVEMRRLLQTHLAPWTTLASDYIRKGQQEGTIYAELDATAYVFQVINLVLGSTATSNVLHHLYEGATPKEAMRQHVSELLRLAYAGLFITRTPQLAHSAEFVLPPGRDTLSVTKKKRSKKTMK